MIKNWYVTGDTHGDMSRFNTNFTHDIDPKDVAIIILGDAGCNYYGGVKDERTKRKLDATGYRYYLVRGNHEMRPQCVEDIRMMYDDEVCGFVYMEYEHPNIRYFQDGGIYFIDGIKTLVIGGAYSVDKNYRILTGKTWFPNEQLTEHEMKEISAKVAGQRFGLVLSHTCPYSWEPQELFLPNIDQSTVDTSMEDWMDKLKDEMDSWGIWLFGHFHADMIIKDYVQMCHRLIQPLKSICDYWAFKDKLSNLRF